MKSFILILCLAQLWGCHSAPHGPGLGYREPGCDDPETEQAALAAVDHINQHLLQGFRHTLNQIDKVKVWARVSEPAVNKLKELKCGAQASTSEDQHLPAQMQLQWGKLLFLPKSKKEGADGRQDRRHSVPQSWISRKLLGEGWKWDGGEEKTLKDILQITVEKCDLLEKLGPKRLAPSCQVIID